MVDVLVGESHDLNYDVTPTSRIEMKHRSFELAEKVAADVKKIQYHCNTWRMKISLCKTEVTLFQAKETCDNSSKNNLCKIDGSKLKYNSKLLGITLDEKLNFQEHVNRTEKKASRA